MDTKMIYDDWAHEETIVSYCNKTETDVFDSTTGNFNNITVDQTKEMNDSEINGNIGHLDNVVGTDGLESLKGTEVDRSKPRMEYPEGHGVIQTASCRLLTAAFSFDSLSGETRESLWQAQNKPKRRKNKPQTTAAHQLESYELHDYLKFHEYLLVITNGEAGTTPLEVWTKSTSFRTTS